MTEKPIELSGASPRESTPTEQFYKDIAADRDAINDGAYLGDEKALLVIKIYRLHCVRPNDPGALGLCIAAYEDWRDAR